MRGSSTTASGVGEATTRRHRSPSARICHPRSPASSRRLRLAVDGTDEFGRCTPGGIVRRHQRLGHDAGHLAVGGDVLEGLEEPVPDHSLGLSAEDVERIRMRQRRVPGALESKEPDLGPIAMGDDELVVSHDGGERLDRGGDVMGLDLGVGRFAPLEQRIASEGHDDPHLSPPGWRP